MSNAASGLTHLNLQILKLPPWSHPHQSHWSHLFTFCFALFGLRRLDRAHNYSSKIVDRVCQRRDYQFFLFQLRCRSEH